MMAVGTCCKRSVNRRESRPSAGPATTLPATASKNVGATAAIRKAVGRDGSNGEAVDQECTGVIQQAFAFEDGQNAMGRSQLAEHGSCRYGVGQSDDRAQRNRRCPWHRRYEHVGDDGDSGGRESDREYDQAGDRRPIVPEISERRVVSRIEQHGCDEERQRKLGRDGERGRAWNKREHRTAEGQEYWVRCSDAARPGRQDHGGDEQTEKLFELPHMSRGWRCEVLGTLSGRAGPEWAVYSDFSDAMSMEKRYFTSDLSIRS